MPAACYGKGLPCSAIRTENRANYPRITRDCLYGRVPPFLGFLQLPYCLRSESRHGPLTAPGAILIHPVNSGPRKLTARSNQGSAKLCYIGPPIFKNLRYIGPAIFKIFRYIGRPIFKISSDALCRAAFHLCHTRSRDRSARSLPWCFCDGGNTIPASY